MKENPKISIIMGIYNCESTLAESIDSLFNQTIQNFELIMCDDGSKDDTYSIAKEYVDKYSNIILLKNDINKGLNYTLNYCLKYARGEYIARQDGDDISLPKRFEEEINFLEYNSHVAFVSCLMVSFDENGDFKINKYMPYPQKIDLVRRSQFAHPCCMIRKKVLDDVNGYTESKHLLRVEDYHLWFKIYSKGYIGHNIQKPLYKFRDDINAYKRRNLMNRINVMHVRHIGIKLLNMSFFYNIYSLRDIVILLIPRWLYSYLHKKLTD
jgi:glycosyltransferase EpsE